MVRKGKGQSWDAGCPLIETTGTRTMAEEEVRLLTRRQLVLHRIVTVVPSYLKQEIGKKFDVDYDALWKTVKDQTFTGKGSLRGIIASNLKGLNGVINSMEDVEQVPKLQIALPVGFEEWDGLSPIKVAYTPLTIDDVDAEDIFAYDGSGEEYVLDAKTPPDFPVMVVGINERTDDEGNVTPGTLLRLPCEDCGGGGGGGGGGGSGGGGSSSGDYIRVKRYKLDHYYGDYEAWPYGDAEITWHITSATGSIYYTNVLDFLESFVSPDETLGDKSWDIIYQDHTYWNWWPPEWHTNRDWQDHYQLIDHSVHDWIFLAPFFTVSALLGDGISSVYLHCYEKDVWYYDYMGAALIDLTSPGIAEGYNEGSLWFRIDYDFADF